MKQALEVKKDLYWVGALDFDLRVFDIIMYSDYGTTYNSYILKGEDKTVLFEVVKEKFFDEFMERASQVCDPAKIDCVVVSHTEPDHAGALAKLLKINPELEVIGSANAIKYLKNITNMTFKSRTIKDNETMNIAGRTLRFLSVPLLHWPDTIYTYIEEEKVLVTCDSFGCHYADEKVFNDKMDNIDDLLIAYKYYFDCIMGPFKSCVLRALDKIKPLEIDVICNGHGPVLRKDIDKFIDLYRQWSQPLHMERPKVVVGYLSSYGYTKKAAEKIHEGLKLNEQVETHFYNLEEISVADFVAQVQDAKGLILGCPTFLADALPPIHEILGHLNPVIHKGLLAASFGSYGWSGEAVKNMDARFKQLKLKMPVPSLQICFNPDDNDLASAKMLGQKFAEAVVVARNERIVCACDEFGCEIELS